MPAQHITIPDKVTERILNAMFKELYDWKESMQANSGAHIINATGTLSDVTKKFNTLLSELEGLGFIKEE